MRLYVSILAVAALSTTACGKKAEQPKPEPAKTEPTKEEPKKDPTAAEPTKEEPKKDPTVAEPTKEEPVKEEPKAAIVVDRTEAAQKAVEAWAAGKLDEVYANFTDDVVMHNVGDPQAPELKGKAALAEHDKALQAQLSDIKAKAARIIETGDKQIIEYVMTATIKTKDANGAELAKAVSSPGAMLLTYNAEGKVTEVWHFRDQASIMMQAGQMPGLPEGFVAATLPETTEIVKGEANPAAAAAYKAFGEKMTLELIDGAIAELIADDFVSTDFRTGARIDKAGMPAYMKAWMSMVTDHSMTVDSELTVGEYHVAVTTNTGICKAGTMGAKADTKITTHMLEISRVVDGKFKSYTGYHNGLEAAAQLGLLGGAAEKPADAGTIGVTECDLYITKMTECLSKVAPEMKATFEGAMKSTVESWKTALAAGGEAGKAAIQTGCKATLDASKQATAAVCPDVKWE